MKIDCYIDLISPYCYLANTRLPGIAARYGAGIDYHPMHIATAKIAAGNYGPSNNEVPAKIAALKQDLTRWARRCGVPLVFPKGIQGEPWNIGTLFAREAGRAQEWLDAAFPALWAQGGDPADQALLAETAKAAGLDEAGFMDYVLSSRGRTDFRQACVKAHQRGVFGAPMVFLGDQVFWGNDRLDFVEEALAAG